MGMALVVIVGALLAFVVVVALWVIGVYNGLQRARVATEGAFSGIDVSLKKRHDLVPNLVETVKGYAAHEKGALEAVMKARASAMGAGSVDERIGAEQQLTGALGRLLAVAEAYPDLKANQNFLQLQGTLGQLEGEIAFARNGYNGKAGDFNTQLAVFPNNVIAGIFRFQPFRFFEVGEGEREAPKVRF